MITNFLGKIKFIINYHILKNQIKIIGITYKNIDFLKALETTTIFRFKALLPPSSLSSQHWNMEATYSYSNTNFRSVLWCQVRLGFQANTNLDRDRQPHDTLVVKFLSSYDEDSQCMDITITFTRFS